MKQLLTRVIAELPEKERQVWLFTTTRSKNCSLWAVHLGAPLTTEGNATDLLFTPKPSAEEYADVIPRSQPLFSHVST